MSSLTEVIDMVWTTAGTDTGTPSSGMDGYSYVFNQSATNTCNNDVDVSVVSGVSSVTLAPGTWYFHLCSVDVAGNTSDTVTAGPYVIGADTVPPQVDVISSVAEPSGGEIVADSVISHGITQFLLSFSESMYDPSGSTESADVTNPANYLLVDPGDDATYDTTGCTLVDDDEEVSLEDVVYDSATVTVALQLPAPDSLPLGNYRLVVCATLEDEDGNLLDGDGDGTGGDDLVRSFQLDRSDLLLNPNLDADVDDWSPSSSAATSFATDDAADAFATAIFYDDSSCGGAQIGSEESTNVVSDDTGGSWEALEIEITSTSDALSALVSFTVSLPVGEDFGFDAWFDSLLFATPDRVPPVDPTVWSTSHTADGWSAD